VTARKRAAPQPAIWRRRLVAAPTSPTVKRAAQRERRGQRFQRRLGQRSIGFRMRQQKNVFHVIPPPSRRRFRARSLRPAYPSRCASGAAVWAASPRRRSAPRWPMGAALARCSAGITVRMLAMPTCGLLRGSGRLPVAHPSTAGGAVQTDTWCGRLPRAPALRSCRRRAPRSGPRPGTAR
jgi:hypothetical protein